MFYWTHLALVFFYCRFFQEFNPELLRDSESQSTWPIADTDDTQEDGVRLKAVYYPEIIPFKRGKGVSLESRCGDTSCKFKIRCYHYVRPGTTGVHWSHKSSYFCWYGCCVWIYTVSTPANSVLTGYGSVVMLSSSPFFFVCFLHNISPLFMCS